MRGQAGDVLALEEDAAGCRLQFADNHVEGGSLAGAIRADQAGNRAGLDFEAAVANRVQATEMHVQVFDL